MALTKQTLIFLSVFTLSFALSSNATSTPILTTIPSPEPQDSPDAPHVFQPEALELALPEISVQNKVASSETEGSKVASTQLQAMERKINEFQKTLEKRLADPSATKPVQTCLKQCQENLGDAIDGIKTSIESIGKNDLAKANTDVSAIATNVDTCNDCFVDMAGGDSEVKAFNEWVRGVTGDCLVNLKKG